MRGHFGYPVHRSAMLYGHANYAARSVTGSWFDARDDWHYGGDALIDVEAACDFGEVLMLTLGARNALNNYPERNPAAAAVAGNLYSLATPFGYNGGYYYLRLAYRWGAKK